MIPDYPRPDGIDLSKPRASGDDPRAVEGGVGTGE